MPRSSSLNTAGVLQHVMVRGIERRDVVLDDHDRSDFLGRFFRLLLKTGID
jgi:putative transposase